VTSEALESLREEVKWLTAHNTWRYEDVADGVEDWKLFQYTPEQIAAWSMTVQDQASVQEPKMSGALAPGASSESPTEVKSKSKRWKGLFSRFKG
jgi:hypothetical protein